jgi:tetratricopeptide (TPR) repeat protein
VADYYEMLGIQKSANADQIRMAYKRLAMKYHPDHNPGSADAEEIFKRVNEAYHTLSDPVKKSRYDAQRSDSFTIYSENHDYQWEQRRRRYYQWQYAQQAEQAPYKLDREYFRIQGLAFLVFIVIAGFCFAVVHTATYFIQQKQQERWRANSQSLEKVNGLFISGRFDDAFTLIHTLKESDPLEYRFNFVHDSLVSKLRDLADERFDQQDFAGAVTHYRILKNYEEPVQHETIRKISLCQYYLGNYKEAIQAMKHLHNQKPKDLQLIFTIGIINLEKLNNPEEALQYFSLGKKLFKQNLSEVYGEAFMLAMDPADAPDIYYDIFIGRAHANLMLGQYEEAIRDCTWAVYLRPLKGEPYHLRALANIESKQFDSICKDLSQAKKLDVPDVADLLKKYCQN